MNKLNKFFGEGRFSACICKIYFKYLVIIIIICILFFQASMKTIYAQTVNVSVSAVDITGINQIVQNGIVYIELREVFKSLGWRVQWNDTDKSIICIKDNDILIFEVNSKEVIFNEETIVLECEVIMNNGVAFVHSKFIAEHFGQEVRWDRERNIAIISENRTIDMLINGKRNIVIMGDGIIVNIFEPYYMDTLLDQISYANSILNRNNPEGALKKYKNITINLCDKESPNIYGEVLNSIGNAYSMMASEKNTRKNIQLAIKNYEKALSYTEKDAKSLLLNNLGNAYKTLWEVSGNKEMLNKALDCYLEALNYFKYSILNEALIYYNLGMIYNDLENTQQAVHYLNMSYEIYQKVSEEYFFLCSLPDFYAEAQFGLGNVCKGLFRINPSNDYFQKAIVAYESVLDVWSIEEHPYNYGKTQECIAELYKNEGTYESLMEAVRRYNKSLKVITIENQPVKYANILVAIGDVYIIMWGKRTDRHSKEQAIILYEEAKNILNPFEDPVKYRYIDSKISYIQKKDNYIIKIFDCMPDVLKNILILIILGRFQ
ncbi:UNVERIFIED_CONTAM: tetratricopeptide repeat protein [Acetivibrio alkalicellulosi]